MKVQIWNTWKQDSKFYLLPSIVVGEDWGYYIEFSFLIWQGVIYNETNFR